MARKLKSMTYKSFKWPHNPEVFNRSSEKNIVSHEFPGIDGAENEEINNKPRVLTGSGVFYGSSAYSQYKKLESIFREKKPGFLNHPIYGKMECTFSKLSVKNEPMPNYVEYDFEFIEHKKINNITKVKVKSSGSSGSSKKTRYYTVKKGDNLWNISKKYYGRGISYKKIANANKKLIKNPNLIYPGWKLVIPY